MPRFDGTGPRGMGPGTGRGLGYCRPMCGCCPMCGCPVNKKDEKEMLEDEKKSIDERLRELEQSQE